MRRVKLGNRLIGDDQPSFIIAEIGSNHNRSLKTVRRLIDAAKDTRADAVKFQSFTVENWISKELITFPTVRSSVNLHKLLKSCELSYSMYRNIKDYCKRRKITCFSSPSHIKDVKMLLSIGTPAFKFGSVQITDIPTIKYAARQKKPIILSTGASSMKDIKAAVNAVRMCGNGNIILMHCTTLYPTPIDKANLNLIRSLRKSFDMPVGFSDHTRDPFTAPIAAIALGASLIEKHITLSRKMKGPDHKFALEPDEFGAMVKAIRETEASLGSSVKKMLPEEREIARLGRRSVVAERDIPKGTTISRKMLTLKRPGTGIEPRYINNIVGKRAKKYIEKDTVIRWEKIRSL